MSHFSVAVLLWLMSLSWPNKMLSTGRLIVLPDLLYSSIKSV